jgi:hypothetical protein
LSARTSAMGPPTLRYVKPTFATTPPQSRC